MDQFNGSKEKMGRFANPPRLKAIAWLEASFVIYLNASLLVRMFFR